MNDSELFDRYARMNLPTSFRVIGIGEATKEIIETVKSYGYDCVSATVLTEPFECVPTDEDKMVIIVVKDNEDHANSIAKTFHDAGVLTLGLLDNADFDCYDSVVSEASCAEYPDIIKAILQPIVTQGMIAYDFNDLQTTLTDAKHFLLKSVTRCGNERVAEAIGDIKRALSSSKLDKIERLSIFLYFNKEGELPLVMQEMTALTDIISELPESVYAIWAVYPDESMKDEGSKSRYLLLERNWRMDKVIQKQLALLKFAILPGILGGIACFIGPPHSALIKANIGVVIGFALQHKYMRPVLKELMKASDDFLTKI